ncbi:MAG TPA: hypothetical protein PL051_00375 [Candidatus Saccharibacteria bacterium]|nr:hypothetical protein [Candidatus Saccharibacteria bacterium]HRJ91311.1 hypothetical protein [Candidatus Saccharibacteria bacterium]
MIKQSVRTVVSYGLLGALSVAAFVTPSVSAVSGGVQGGADAARGDDQTANLFGTSGVFSTITNTLLFVLGAISVIMIIIGGLRYVISGGNSTAVTAAKNTILYAIVGVIVALLAYAIINFVLTSFTNSSNGGTNI